MKMTNFLIAAIFFFQFSNLEANNSGTKSCSDECHATYPVSVLAPATPCEATFEDNSVLNNFITLSPTAPAEADFSDAVQVAASVINVLVPVTPSEADFYDSSEEQTVNLSALAPVTPADADFSDTL